jgi:hypothetical protein
MRDWGSELKIGTPEETAAAVRGDKERLAVIRRQVEKGGTISGSKSREYRVSAQA